MYYKTLNITTIEEEKKHLQKTEDKDLRRYRLNTFDGFVEYWGIEKISRRILVTSVVS